MFVSMSGLVSIKMGDCLVFMGLCHVHPIMVVGIPTTTLVDSAPKEAQ